MSVEVSEPREDEFVVVIRPSANKFWKTAGLKIAARGADRWAHFIGMRMHKHLVHGLKLGLGPSGSPHKPLKAGTWRAKQAAEGLRPKARGFTDRAIFVNSIKLKRLKASKTVATYLIASDKPEIFDEWLVDEKSRGVDYFEIAGGMKKLIDKAVNDIVDRLARAANKGAAARASARSAARATP